MLSMNIRRNPQPTQVPPAPPRGKRSETDLDVTHSHGQRDVNAFPKRYEGGVDLFAAHKATTPKPKAAEPQTLGDIVAGREQQISKLDARLQQMNDPNWLAEQKSKVEKKRAEAEHEVEILKAAEGAPKVG